MRGRPVRDLVVAPDHRDVLDGGAQQEGDNSGHGEVVAHLKPPPLADVHDQPEGHDGDARASHGPHDDDLLREETHGG